MLLEKGADANKKDKNSYPSYGRAPLHCVCDNSSATVEIFEMILEKSSINIKTSRLNNALHVAFQSDSPNEDIIKLLIEKGCSLKERDNREKSPLQHACKIDIKFHLD